MKSRLVFAEIWYELIWCAASKKKGVSRIPVTHSQAYFSTTEEAIEHAKNTKLGKKLGNLAYNNFFLGKNSGGYIIIERMVVFPEGRNKIGYFLDLHRPARSGKTRQK
jgi:DNA phosphorothioation-dependent restriction protein DptG